MPCRKDLPGCSCRASRSARAFRFARKVSHADARSRLDVDFHIDQVIQRVEVFQVVRAHVQVAVFPVENLNLLDIVGDDCRVIACAALKANPFQRDAIRFGIPFDFHFAELVRNAFVDSKPVERVGNGIRGIGVVAQDFHGRRKAEVAVGIVEKFQVCAGDSHEKVLARRIDDPEFFRNVELQRELLVRIESVSDKRNLPVVFHLDRVGRFRGVKKSEA